MGKTFETADTALPDVNERDLAGYWEGTRARQLRVQRCSCGEVRWPPRASCGVCRSMDFEWTPVATKGELFTWTVVAQTGMKGFSELTPYAVAVIQLDGVPVRMAGYTDADPATLAAGDRFKAVFVQKSDEVVIPIWRRIEP